jgi:hypothetical protein
MARPYKIWSIPRQKIHHHPLALAKQSSKLSSVYMKANAKIANGMFQLFSFSHETHIWATKIAILRLAIVDE